MTLDGTLDLVANATGKPGQEKQPVDVRAEVAGAQEEELDRFFAVCAAAGPKCAFSAGDPKRKFAGILAHASRGPGVASLLKTVTSALYQSGRWKRLAQTLAAMPADPGPAVPVLDPYVPAHSPGFLAVQCVDSDNPQSPADYAALAAGESVRRPYGGRGAVPDGPGRAAGGEDLRARRGSLSLREIRRPGRNAQRPGGTGSKDPAAGRARVVSSRGAGPPQGRCGDLGPRRAAHLRHSAMTRMGSPAW
ncbi:hypothetical protein [Amycolatopsis sp. CA-126428]|uniref:hypothetical protein n=1 Tax=Amycolatopsis sp. CA-126428 TaxID=2073158 RepID=UPI0018EC9C1D|nr:hypothetical protein [Amycolatopsis sp. CA-126428]